MLKEGQIQIAHDKYFQNTIFELRSSQGNGVETIMGFAAKKDELLLVSLHHHASERLFLYVLEESEFESFNENVWKFTRKVYLRNVKPFFSK